MASPPSPENSVPSAHSPNRHDPILPTHSAGAAGAPAEGGLALRFSDALSFSSGLAAAIGGALSLCASRLLVAPESARSAVLVVAGAFIIYSLDRLRDIERDIRTSPLRTAFVQTHRTILVAATGLAGLVLLLGLAGAPARTILLCTAIGGVGFFHRRLKGRAMLKTVYVSVAWTLGLIGLPVSAAPQTIRFESAAGLALILLATLFANLIASNLRDDETEALRDQPTRALWIARLAALSGVAIALLFSQLESQLGPERGLALGLVPGPEQGAARAIFPAVWIPVAELLALVRFRPTERYGHSIVDGALLFGALATLLHSTLIGLVR